MFDRNKSFEIRDDGLLIEGGANTTSGPNVPTHVANNGDIFHRVGTNTEQMYRRENGIWVLKSFSVGDATKGNVEFAFTSDDGTDSGIRVHDGDYTNMSNFIFSGTTELGTLSKIKVTVKTKDSDGIDLKVFDLTNALTIVEKLNFNSAIDDVFEILDLGTLANVPTGEAIFEIQGRKNAGGSGEGWLASLKMEFV